MSAPERRKCWEHLSLVHELIWPCSLLRWAESILLVIFDYRCWLVNSVGYVRVVAKSSKSLEITDELCELCYVEAADVANRS